MIDLEELLARESARDLIARYNRAGDRGDIPGLVALFAEDGVLDVGEHGGRWAGRDRIRSELDAVTERSRTEHPPGGRVQHHVSSTALSVDGDRIRADSYFAVHTAIGLDHWGRYRDVISRGADGSWRFAERIVIVDGHSEGSLMVRERS